MSNRLEHVAIYCKDINQSIEFYRTHFGGQPTAIRKGAAGYASVLSRSTARRRYS